MGGTQGAAVGARGRSSALRLTTIREASDAAEAAAAMLAAIEGRGRR